MLYDNSIIFAFQISSQEYLKMRQPMITAFVTRSSAATLPVSFVAADEIGDIVCTCIVAKRTGLIRKD